MNRFENNLLDYFIFIDKNQNYISEIKSLSNTYVFYHEEIIKCIEKVIGVYNTIIFIEEKEILNIISKVNTIKIEEFFNNKYIFGVKNRKSYYLLNIEDYNELLSLNLLFSNEVDIYTKLDPSIEFLIKMLSDRLK